MPVNWAIAPTAGLEHFLTEMFWYHHLIGITPKRENQNDANADHPNPRRQVRGYEEGSKGHTGQAGRDGRRRGEEERRVRPARNRATGPRGPQGTDGSESCYGRDDQDRSEEGR